MTAWDGLAKHYALKTSPASRELASRARILRLAKGEVLPPAEEPTAYHLLSGVLAVILQDPNGERRVENYIWKYGQLYGSIHHVTGANFAMTETALAAEPTELLALELKDLDRLMLEDGDLLRFYAALHRENARDLWKRNSILITMSAAERYEWFLSNFPGLIDRVQHRSIASFLNMTPVSISRIRRARKETGKH